MTKTMRRKRRKRTTSRKRREKKKIEEREFMVPDCKQSSCKDKMGAAI